tara:strand:- start:752 stop:973 length:222 start_codon:yes stop_codon:yes gene_type:complete
MKSKILETRKTKLSDGRVLLSKKYITDTMDSRGNSRKEAMWLDSINDINQNIYKLYRKGLLSEKQYQRLANLK